MEWLEKLAQIKKASGKTHEEISQLSGVPKSTIDKLFANITKNPPYATVEKIIHALGYSVDALSSPVNGPTHPTPTTLSPEQREYLDKYFTLNHEGRGRVHATIDYEFAKQHGAKKVVSEIIFPPKTVTVTKYFAPVCAGHGNYLDDNVLSEEVKILDNKYTYGADYIVPLQGDSMEPEFYDGNILIVSDGKKVPYIEGRVAIFLVNGDAYLRQQLTIEGGVKVLRAYNPKYEDIVLNEYTDVSYVGYVVGIIDDSWIVG